MKYTYESVKQELETLTAIITQTVPVEQIYLFGSYAYGTPQEDSDLDLYVVLKDDAPIRELDAIDKIWGAVHKARTRPMDILALKSNRFLARKQSPTLERKIFREGIKLYG